MYKQSPYRVWLDSFSKLRIETDANLESIVFEHCRQFKNLEFEKEGNGYAAYLPIKLDLQQPLIVHLDNKYEQHIEIGMITTTDEFDQNFSSTLSLGAIYSKKSTVFRVWSPVATEIVVVIDNHLYLKMNGDGKHYEIKVEDDLEGKEYYYLVTISGQQMRVVDPYALNVTLNTKAGIIVDSNKYQFRGTYNPNDKQTMVIYETSVCDFTSDVESDFALPGTFLGFNQSKRIANQPIGIDYLKQLGISHLQLMPIYDFGSVDEKIVADNNYNWGYDPVHYNVPEGSYTVGTNFDSRIIECKALIDGIKQRGIGVIMDVVYNHVYNPQTFNYNQLVPNYYFRFTPSGEYHNGSLCGNEVASERIMVRRYIIDTIKTWVQIYGVDGIRIDLMGLIDIATIQAIENQITQINPGFMIYGEGWNIECGLKPNQRSNQINAYKLPTVGHFNDELRDFIKGDNNDCSKRGYIQGGEDEQQLALMLNGLSPNSNKCYASEEQLINYLSCHDDYTLYDYLKMNEQNEELLTNQIIVGYELMFSAKGIPFIHSGCEFKRTKNGLKNTYNSSKQLNALKWKQILEHNEIVSTVMNLVNRRKNAKYE